MKTIVITGSTLGIGFGLAYEFLKLGHQVVINSRNEENLKHALDKLSDYNENLFGEQGDITNPNLPGFLFDKAVQKFGKVDIWINNAGISNEYKPVWELNHTNLKQVFDINIFGTANATLTIFNKMQAQGFGKIFNFEGLGSDGRIIDKLSIYGTSKRAINYFTKAFAQEIQNTNVQIGVIQPGMVLTDLVLKPIQEGKPEEFERFKKVFNILGERVEVVAPWICKRILNSKKNYDKIKYNSMLKILKNIINKRKLI